MLIKALLYFFLFLSFIHSQKKNNFFLVENYISKYYFKNKSKKILKWQKNTKKNKNIFSISLPYSKEYIFNFFISFQKKKLSNVAMIFKKNISQKKGLFFSFGKKKKIE